MTELSLLTHDQAKQQCNVLGSVGDHLPFDCYSHFIYVPYQAFSTRTEPMKHYQDKVKNIAVFLVRVDTSDLRHVLVGFLSLFDRLQFLKTTDIIIRRGEPQG